MPKTEQALWNSLKSKLPKKTHFQRIENRAGQGMPDVYLCVDGVPCWVELKIIKNDRVSISKSQIAWHLGHTRCNGVSFFLLHAPSTGDVFLFDGGSAVAVHGSRICDLRPAALYIGAMSGVGAALRSLAAARWSATCDLRPASP